MTNDNRTTQSTEPDDMAWAEDLADQVFDGESTSNDESDPRSERSRGPRGSRGRSDRSDRSRIEAEGSEHEGRAGRDGRPDRGPRGGRGHGPGRSHRGRGRNRGDVRLAVLSLLNEQEMHGYQIMREVSERSGGSWRPSPGSIYPLLQQLADEGLVVPNESGDRKVFSLTEEGRQVAESTGPDDIWKAAVSSSPTSDLKAALSALSETISHLSRTGTTDQLTQAQQVLTKARKQIYALLAEDD